MGPTNVALVKLFRADQALRQAQERLDAASKNVRVQERRVNDLTEKVHLAQAGLRETQSRGKQLELDLASRDARIEKLRTQQQSAKNNKEYQAFLVEISTQKVDRAKVEEDSLKTLEAIEKTAAETAALTAHTEDEREKLAALKAEVGASLASHEAEVESLRAPREAAAQALAPQLRSAFERLAEHHEGEALAALSKPDRRREEYLCTACNMELARDVYNKLHTRDEVVYCPSCRRILYLPEDMTPEAAIGAPKAPSRGPTPRKVRPATRSRRPTGLAPEPAADSDVVIEPRAKGKLGEVLRKAQGETVSSAVAAGEKPADFEVEVDGELAGIYKGQSQEKLARAIDYYMKQSALFGAVVVKPVAPPPAPAAEAPAEPPSAANPAPQTSIEPAPAPVDQAPSTVDLPDPGAGAEPVQAGPIDQSPEPAETKQT